jgi:hypothetical protein
MIRWIRGGLVLLQLLSVGWAVSAQDWIPARIGDPVTRGLVAGSDLDGSPTYIIRSQFEGGLTIGKYIPRSKSAYVSWGGKENRVTSIELYIGGGIWRSMNAGDPVPEGAVAGGREADGSPLYIIRAGHDTAIVPGKYSSLTRKGYIAFGGREIELSRWEILVRAGPEADNGPVEGLVEEVRNHNPQLPVYQFGLENGMGSASGELNRESFRWNDRAVNAFSLDLRRGDITRVSLNGGPDSRAQDFELFVVDPRGHVTGVARSEGTKTEMELRVAYDGPHTLLIVQHGPRGLARYFLRVETRGAEN